jgi:hypothetical protein
LLGSHFAESRDVLIIIMLTSATPQDYKPDGTGHWHGPTDSMQFSCTVRMGPRQVANGAMVERIAVEVVTFSIAAGRMVSLRFHRTLGVNLLSRCAGGR